MRLSRRTLLAAGLTAPLAACTTEQRRGAGGPVEITFWSALRGSQQVVDAFNSSQNRIKVIFQQIPSGGQGGYAKLSNAARAGNAPDIATIEYPQVPGLRHRRRRPRHHRPRRPTGCKQKLLPQALKLTTFDNRVFSVPLDIEPMVLHYRTDLFERNGFELPHTWDDFAELAQSRAGQEQGPEARAVPHGRRARSSPCFAWQAGAQWFDTSGGTWRVSLADEPTPKVAAYWQRLIDEDLVFRNAGDSKQHDAQIGQDRVLTQAQRRLGRGCADAGEAGAEGQVAHRRPCRSGTTPAVGTHGGSTFAITKDSQEPEAAMEFIEWQVTPPGRADARG